MSRGIESLKGVKALINFWFRDLSSEYQEKLYASCVMQYFEKMNYYRRKPYNLELSERLVISKLENKVYSIANVR
ncbi:hypothetical protein GW932_00775 [archaeon]|nr:hypothetical protein [archaeon]